LKVKDVRNLIEQPSSIVPDETLLTDYERAPQPRQEEIMKFLLSVALDKNQSDLVQQNAFLTLSHLQSRTHNQVILKLGSHLQNQIGRNGIDTRIARVANAAGIFPHLRQTARKDFFEDFYKKMEKVSIYWSAYEHHGELLRNFKECGALNACPEETRNKILKWLTLTYIGTPGGRTSYGNIRNVFYSNSAAPLIADIISNSSDLIKEELKNLSKDKDIKQAISNQHVSRRYEDLIDLAESG
jgi:hypothetical protein